MFVHVELFYNIALTTNFLISGTGEFLYHAWATLNLVIN